MLHQKYSLEGVPSHFSAMNNKKKKETAIVAQPNDSVRIHYLTQHSPYVLGSYIDHV